MLLRACATAAVLSSALCGLALSAAVRIQSFTPSLSSPQPLGTPVTFTAAATDTGAGPLAFQFNVAPPGGVLSTIRNFNIGVPRAGVWTSQPFVWAGTLTDGNYTIQVVAKDFASGLTASSSTTFTLTTLVSGNSLTVVSTPNALVALAAIPPCAGSSARAVFRAVGSTASTKTNFVKCQGTTSTNIYLGGMYASTTYSVSYQIQTGSKIVNGSGVATFTTGQIPASFPLPARSVLVPPASHSYLTDSTLLHFPINLGATSNQPMATDLQGRPIWYFNSGDSGILPTRPLPGGYFLMLQTGTAWSTAKPAEYQLLRKIDLAGNIVAETNVGLLQRQLLALGATDLQSCGNIPIPAPVGSACLASLSHDAIVLPSGNFAFLGVIEKIFPPGTQGNTSGLNVEILGDAVIVLDSDLNASWFWDAFQHDGGGTQLDIDRPATLGDTCTPSIGGCGPIFLYGTSGVAAPPNDWLHANALYFESSDNDFIVSLRAQDWIVKIDYNNGAGTGNILWRLGLGGDFTFQNVDNDPYPWFSHQYEPAFETNGLMTLVDNGNTRVALEGGGNSRGMALDVDQSALTVTPVLSQDLGYYSVAAGSAQLLGNGNYHFLAGIAAPSNYSYSLEYVPVAGVTTATEVYNLQTKAITYRSFRMSDLYAPPAN